MIPILDFEEVNAALEASALEEDMQLKMVVLPELVKPTIPHLSDIRMKFGMKKQIYGRFPEFLNEFYLNPNIGVSAFIIQTGDFHFSLRWFKKSAS